MYTRRQWHRSAFYIKLDGLQDIVDWIDVRFPISHDNYLGNKNSNNIRYIFVRSAWLTRIKSIDTETIKGPKWKRFDTTSGNAAHRYVELNRFLLMLDIVFVTLVSHAFRSFLIRLFHPIFICLMMNNAVPTSLKHWQQPLHPFARPQPPKPPPP